MSDKKNSYLAFVLPWPVLVIFGVIVRYAYPSEKFSSYFQQFHYEFVFLWTIFVMIILGLFAGSLSRLPKRTEVLSLFFSILLVPNFALFAYDLAFGEFMALYFLDCILKNNMDYTYVLYNLSIFSVFLAFLILGGIVSKLNSRFKN